MTSNGRVARLTALALATGTLVAAGAGSAGAANTSTKTFTTQGGGSVIHLEVNLPVAVPGVPQKLVQDIVMTGTSTRSGTSPASLANAFLGQAEPANNIPVVSKTLAMSSSASLGQPSTGNQNYASALSGLGISGELLALNSTAINPNVDGDVASGRSAIADLRVAGGTNLNLQALLDALAGQLSGLLSTVKLPVSTVEGTASTATTTVTGLLTTLSNQVADLADSTTGNASKPYTDQQRAALDEVSGLLNALPAALTAQLKLVAADSSLLHVGLIESTNTVTRKNDTVTNATKNVLTDIEVLGGLVTVQGLASEVSATLGDGISSASPKTTTKSNLLTVDAAGLLKLEVTDKLQAVISSGTLPAEVVTVVNSTLAQVTTLVNSLLGATLTLGQVTTNIETADRAAATVSAATLTIDPKNPVTGARLLPMTEPLVRIDFVPATAEVLKAQGSTPPTKVTKPVQVAAKGTLAQTGVELPLTGAIAVALMGMAAIARRRRGLAD